MKPHPAVPSAIVIKHVQGSKNRVARHAQDAENVRRGMRALSEDATALRAAIRTKPEGYRIPANAVEGEIAVLERGFAALEFVARDLVAGHEQMIAIEQAFQNECLLWLNRKEPQVPIGQKQPPICYVPSKAVEVPTPKGVLEGRDPKGDPTSEPDPKKVAGFYTMADGTKVYVNHLNEPVPAPSDKDVAVAEELVKAPNNSSEAYIPMPVDPPTVETSVEVSVSTPNLIAPADVAGPEASNGTPSIGDLA